MDDNAKKRKDKGQFYMNFKEANVAVTSALSEEERVQVLSFLFHTEDTDDHEDCDLHNDDEEVNNHNDDDGGDPSSGEGGDGNGCN